MIKLSNKIKPAHETFQIQEFFPYHARTFYKCIATALTGVYSNRYGLQPAQWRVMAVLGTEHQYTAGEIVNITSTDKVAVSRAVNKMISLGLLKRTANSSDRRSSLLALTTKGQNIYLDLVPKVVEVERALMKGISKKERMLLLKIFSTVQSNAKDLAAKQNH